MTHKQSPIDPLADHLAAAIFVYQLQGNEVSLQGILTSLETIRYELTEEWIKQHPNYKWLPVTKKDKR